jgi:hypothetical protein
VGNIIWKPQSMETVHRWWGGGGKEQRSLVQPHYKHGKYQGK